MTMKFQWLRKVLSVVVVCAMAACLCAAAAPVHPVYAAGESEDEDAPEPKGKYVGNVFIAYGKTEKDAKDWLIKHGWEPVEGDFNAGKASYFDNNDVQDQNVAAVMGIVRTNDEESAVTDMAVMNMKGGYSLPKYEELVKEKKKEINEFINRFMAVIQEFRQNYNGEGSAYGQTRAKLAYDILNKFYDGDPDDPYAVSDTGMKLGDLFLAPTVQEGGKNGGDLEQLMLESSGAALVAVETFLALGADAGKETWLERACGLTGDEMEKNLVKYVPEAAGQDVAPSAVRQFLGQHYGNVARTLAEEWTDIHDTMLWFEQYNEKNGLWQNDGEEDDAYAARIDQYFAALKEADKTGADAEAEELKYANARILYFNMYEVPYQGEWGETLGDFFNPADGKDYSLDADNFLPLAAGLSDGQRTALDFLSLNMLLMIGCSDEKGFKMVMPDISSIFGDKTEVSIYTGVNREAFRGGTAITNEALMEQNAGRGAAFDRIWDNTGIVAISSYIAAALSIPMLIAGGVMKAKGFVYSGFCAEDVNVLRQTVKTAESNIAKYTAVVNRSKVNPFTGELSAGARRAKVLISVNENEKKLAQAELTRASNSKITTRTGYAGRVMLGIGGALLIGAAIVKGIQLYKYYQRDMTPIPLMIVDESDIVTYLTDENGKPLLDENGNQKKSIDFNTYEYYMAVKCNRPDVGEIGDWQDGVEEYKDHGCYDIADLNCDMGQEWLALYTVNSKSKGAPILADSLKLQYGKKDMPQGCSQALHLFTYTNAVDLGDTAWAYNNKKGGVYFFWDADQNAYAGTAATAFTPGQLALAGIGGLFLGIIGGALVCRPRRRRDGDPSAA